MMVEETTSKPDVGVPSEITGTPLMSTAVAPVKFVPKIVTLPPTGPLPGVKAVMVGAEFGGDRRGGVRAHDSRHEAGVRRVDARAGCRKAGVSRRLDIDPPSAEFIAQGEVAGEGRAGLKLKNVAGERLVEGELEIAVGTDDDHVAAGGRRIRSVEEDLRERGQDLRCGASRNQKYEDESQGKATT